MEEKVFNVVEEKLLSMLRRFGGPIPEMTNIMEKAIEDIHELMKEDR